jgi:hypothetical protein
MIDGKRIVALVPAGERRYSRILARYLENEAKLGDLDEVRWMLNTDNVFDIDWIRALPDQNPIHWVVQGPLPTNRAELIRMIAVYQDREGRDPNTVYVRIDHDIVYMTPGLVDRMARAAIRAAAEDKLMVFPYVLNAPHGKESPPGAAEAERLHREFLAGGTDYPSLPTEDVREGQFSANCMAWLGSRLPSLTRSIIPGWKMHEEYVLTHLWMQETGRPHIIDPSCGVAVHFSFHGQREHLDGTDLLTAYEELCRTVTGLEPV